MNVDSQMMLLWIMFSLCLTTVSANEGWFWHVTDFHYDFSYTGRDLSCSENVTVHGEFGDYWCDSPWLLIKTSVEYMKSTKPDVDFILWTGDNALHTSNDNLSTDIVDDILGNITNLINEAFPSVPVFPTFGNHDYFPKNQFPPHGNGLYNRTFDRWSHWIGNLSTQETTFKKGGYYTVLTIHGLRIVALNTNMYLTYDKQSEHIEDPADQFMWLERVLEGAAAHREKVLITAHVPSGIGIPGEKPWMFQRFNKKMNDVIRRHSDVIVGTHFGHEHFDNFRVLYKEGKPVVSQFCAPSVTPWRYKAILKDEITDPAHNPAVRLVKYDRHTGRHLNIIQYYMNLPGSNGQQRPVWVLGYNATRDYDIEDITPVSLHKLIQLIKANDKEEYAYYLKWRYGNVADKYTEQCKDICRINLVCNLDNVDQTLFDACVKTAVGKASFLKQTQSYLFIFFVVRAAYNYIV